jgi:5,10-methenyltetrahydromethanopterin hydrogenase
MNGDERSALNNKEMLFTLLTALIKKNDGEIRISEDEMDAVVKSDMVMMYYDKGAKEIILSLHLLSGPNDDEVF